MLVGEGYMLLREVSAEVCIQVKVGGILVISDFGHGR